MKAYISENVQGIYAFDEQGNLIAKREFEAPEKSLEKLLKGKPVEELINLAEELMKKGFNELIFEHQELARKVKAETGINTDYKFPNPAGETLRKNPREFLGDECSRSTSKLVWHSQGSVFKSRVVQEIKW